MSLKSQQVREQILRETRRYWIYYRDNDWVECQYGYGLCCHTYCKQVAVEKNRPVETVAPTPVPLQEKKVKNPGNDPF